jgi:quercetin dioxygenase-like cupin family protein
MAIKRNVFTDVSDPLEMHEDDRGKIADIFYNEQINHVAIITSKKGISRGNHYHKQTTQHTLVTKGSLIYLSQPSDKSEPVKAVLLKPGDIATSSPGEVHAMLFPEDNEFLAFSSGLRGGKDYEKDTFRVPALELPEDMKHHLE